MKRSDTVRAFTKTGRFILTGSQQFGLITGVTQSLAGRIDMLTLLPFSLKELNLAISEYELSLLSFE